MPTNLYESENARDNEQRKFQADGDGNVAVNIKGKVLDLILSALGGAANTTSTIFNVSCPLVNTEYSQALPSNTKKFVIKARKNSEIKFSYTSGATEWLTIPIGGSFQDDNFYSSQIIYFKNSKADEVIEILAHQ